MNWDHTGSRNGTILFPPAIDENIADTFPENQGIYNNLLIFPGQLLLRFCCKNVNQEHELLRLVLRNPGLGSIHSLMKGNTGSKLQKQLYQIYDP